MQKKTTQTTLYFKNHRNQKSPSHFSDQSLPTKNQVAQGIGPQAARHQEGKGVSSGAQRKDL